MHLTSFLLGIFPLILSSCIGYQLGTSKPKTLEGIDSLAVALFSNGTSEPRAEALLNSAITQAIISDGTYQIANFDQADAVLEGKLEEISYNTLRSSRLDSLLAEELINQVTITWSVRSAKDPSKVLSAGVTKGRSTFFADSNLQMARRNALPDAFTRTSTALISQLATGY